MVKYLLFKKIVLGVRIWRVAMTQMTVLAKSIKRAEQCVDLKAVIGRIKNKFVYLGQIHKQRHPYVNLLAK